MGELKRVEELRVDEYSRRRFIENQDTINELTARTQGVAFSKFSLDLHRGQLGLTSSSALMSSDV